MYHHIEDRDVSTRKVRKALKPNGRVAIVDFYKQETLVEPPMQMRLSEKTVQKELEAIGLAGTKKPTVLPYRYTLIAQFTTTSSAPSPLAGQ